MTHLALGPPGQDPEIQSEDHDHDSLDPKFRVREWVYQHIQVLVEHLIRLDRHVAIDVPDDAFDELEQVES